MAISTAQWPVSSDGKIIMPSWGHCLRRYFKSKGFPEEVIQTICASWRSGTEKQYGAAWRTWCLWCASRKRDPVQASEVTVLSYLSSLLEQGKSYSVINTHKSMIIQTLKLLGNVWCDCPSYITRFMKGLFNKMPPVP